MHAQRPTWCEIDLSAITHNLATLGGMVGPKVMAGGMNLFTQASDGIPQRVLPVVYGNQEPPTRPTSDLSAPIALGGVPVAPPVPAGAPGSLPPSTLGQ